LTTSFLRGTTLNNCIIVVDEIQNCSFGELDTVITRVGSNSKIIFCGDHRQDDLSSDRKKEYSGIGDFLRVLRQMPSFEFIEFGVEDIVRSGLVKEYLIVRDRMDI